MTWVVAILGDYLPTASGSLIELFDVMFELWQLNDIYDFNGSLLGLGFSNDINVSISRIEMFICRENCHHSTLPLILRLILTLILGK